MLKALTLSKVLTKTHGCPPLPDSLAVQTPSHLGRRLSVGRLQSPPLCFQWALILGNFHDLSDLWFPYILSEAIQL